MPVIAARAGKRRAWHTRACQASLITLAGSEDAGIARATAGKLRPARAGR